VTALERFVTAAGVRLRAVEHGGAGAPGAAPLLVLHGFTGCAEAMEEVAQALSADGARRVVCLDLVGHGGSASPADPAAYGMARCTAQVTAAARELGLGRPHMLGYSMGGRVALSLCAARPGAFRSAVLVGATPGLADAAEREARVSADEALAAGLERDGLEAFVERWMALPLFAGERRRGEAFLARQRALRLANDPRGLAASLRGMGTGAMPPLHAALPATSLPVLLVTGGRDEKFCGIAAEMAVALPDARRVTLSGVGHAAHLEAPEAFAARVREFLGRVDRETGRAGRPAPAPAPSSSSPSASRRTP